MKKDKKPDTMADIDNYNFYDRQTDIHTDIRTWRLYDRPGPEGRVSENLKFINYMKLLCQELFLEYYGSFVLPRLRRQLSYNQLVQTDTSL